LSAPGAGESSWSSTSAGSTSSSTRCSAGGCSGAELGPDALTVELPEFAQRIRRHPGELKNLLRNQAFIAGIGNAYSDEILHDAALLPLRKRLTLKAEDVARLHASTRKVLSTAIESIRAQPNYEPHKQDRSFMAVHTKGGGTCPRCGHRISELTARGENTDFCRGCQH
jgi:formamidopyrimidine-DNA glycosylase